MLIKALREEFQTRTVETNYKSMTEDFDVTCMMYLIINS